MVDIVRDPDISLGSPTLESHADITITGYSGYIDATPDDLLIRRVDSFVPRESTRISTYMCRFKSGIGVNGTETILVSEKFDFDISDARAVAFELIPVTPGIDVVVGVADLSDETLYEMVRLVEEEVRSKISVKVPNETDEGGADA